MDEKFLTGIVLGMLGGALIVTNSVQARQFVENGQQQVKKKAQALTTQKNKKTEQ